MSGAASADGTEPDERSLRDLEQTIADADQTESDLDQTSSDIAQHSSDRDQIASDRDQQAADIDQASSDRAQDGAKPADYARTRRDRSQSTLERDLSTHTRSETGRIRDAAAVRRDHLADERDAVAVARDRLAASLDAEIDRLEDDIRDGELMLGKDLLRRAAGDRSRAAESRARAAAQREDAARDRTLAAEDRERAAVDRAGAAEELAHEGIDHLTGALRRRVGLDAIQREMDRALRSREALVIAFVDVIGLKALNDTRGHPAGDELLRAVVTTITQHLRSYDVITRFGGDEFVCSLAGGDAGGARERFREVSAQLAAASDGGAITVGFAERLNDDSLDVLIGRADAAMIEARALG